MASYATEQTRVLTLQDFPVLKQTDTVTDTVTPTFPVCLVIIPLNKDHEI